METNNPYDLALSGAGFFVLRTEAGALYTRNGQFTRDADGRLVDARGAVLQADGADLVLKDGEVEVTPEGVVLEDGQPVARLDIVELSDPASVDDGEARTAEAPGVRQGALEMSNVSTGAEMVQIMGALRRAEAGQRLAIVYDDLVGRAITTFGQA